MGGPNMPFKSQAVSSTSCYGRWGIYRKPAQQCKGE